MKLLSFKPLYINEKCKYSFTLEFQGEQREMILKEKHDWPMIFGQDMKLVEKWLFKRYGSLCYLTFGILT
jgi:hypothetical protein